MKSSANGGRKDGEGNPGGQRYLTNERGNAFYIAGAAFNGMLKKRKSFDEVFLGSV